MIMNISDTILDLFKPFFNFFRDLWNDFYSFGLQYLPKDVLNIFIFIVGLGILLVIILAIMNHK